MTVSQQGESREPGWTGQGSHKKLSCARFSACVVEITFDSWLETSMPQGNTSKPPLTPSAQTIRVFWSRTKLCGAYEASKFKCRQDGC